MKRLIVFAVLVAVASGLAHAQLYIKAGAGYAFSSGSELIDRDRTESATADAFTNTYGSYGAGFEVTGAVGLHVTTSVALQLDVVYNLGPSYEINEVRLNPANNRTRTYSGSMLSLAPSVVVSGQAWGLKPYGRFGFAIGFPSAETKEVRQANTVTDTYSGGQFFGFQGGLGVTFSAGASLTMFAEATLQSGAWSPTKLEEKDGATTTTITLKDEFSDAEPFVAAQPSIPFGSVGLRAGVMFGL